MELCELMASCKVIPKDFKYIPIEFQKFPCHWCSNCVIIHLPDFYHNGMKLQKLSNLNYIVDIQTRLVHGNFITTKTHP